MQNYISGIQQIGIGVTDADKSLQYYARLFGMNALVFNDVSDATLMTKYTGGKVYNRQAALVLNTQGGGGFELWQFKNRQPAPPAVAPQYGDVGIYAARMKCADVEQAHRYFTSLAHVSTSGLLKDVQQRPHFFVCDEQGNHFNMVTGSHWFQQKGGITGGVTGAVIGVTNMKRSLLFYKWLLNVEDVVYDEIVTGHNGERYHKVLLQKQASGKGAFAKLLGPIELELVQSLNRQPTVIYSNRFWGDLGFIHLCFDVYDMCGLKNSAVNKGYSFTIDSLDSFAMDAASGRFCYMEDPDGTLVELVETHKVPIAKKYGLYLNLKKRNLAKPLPDWMIKLLALSKVK